jgi:hypothetical protein
MCAIHSLQTRAVDRMTTHRVPLWEGAPIEVEVLSAPFTELGPSEVFVFGSNGDGFHGAGSAGLACRGTAENTWRRDEWFTLARESPEGSPERIGTWAVFGCARGYQEGRCGRSYAVQTISFPGARRSTTRREIYAQLRQLVAFARTRPELRFVVTPLGEGYSGYTTGEMAEVWRELHRRVGIPENLRFIRLAGRTASLT